MTYGEYFLYFSAGAFWAVMLWANGKNLHRRYQSKRGMSKLDKLSIKNNNLNAKTEAETHVLSWRYKGKMQEVKIIIDPSLDDISSEVDLDDAMKRGEAGELALLMKGDVSQETKDKMASQEAFVFSRKSVEAMRTAGLSPDEVVTKILKAAGRMD